MNRADAIAACALLLVAALALFSLPARADGSRAFLVAPLLVNEQPSGEVFAYRDGDDVLLRPSDLARAGIRIERLRGTIVRLDDAPLEDEGYVSLASLTPSIEYLFDEELVLLRLAARPELLRDQVLDFSTRVRPADLQREQAPSLFLNYAARAAELSDDSLRALTLSGEMGASADGMFGYSSMSTRTDGTPVRGLSRLSFDLPDQLARLTFGDDFTSTTALGGGAFVGGVHFARRFELDPWLVRTPLPSLSGAAETPSTLEVYMDGVLVRREQIAPGTFEIRNLPVTAGSGEARYVLRDAFGRETEVLGSYTVGASLLQPGLTDYAYTLGFRREGLGLSSTGYTDPVFLGAHRLGIAEWFTAGLRLEAAEELASGGGGLVFRLPAGVLSLEGAGSWADGRSGAASVLGWSYAGRAIGLSLWTQAMTDAYANASLDPRRDRALFDAGAGVSLPLFSFASANLRASHRNLRDAGNENRQELHVHWRLLPQLSLGTSAIRSATALGDRFEAFASLSVLLPRSATAQLWASSASDGDRAGFAVQESSREEIGWDYRAALTQGDVDVIDLRAGYRGTKGQVRADLFSWDGRESVGTEVAGSVVAIGNRVFLSRPIDRSFALVRVPGVPGATVRLNHREVGATDEDGELLVNGLQSYDANRITVDADDVPFDRSVADLDAVVAPPRGGGTITTFQSREIRAVRGRVIASAGGRRQSAVVHGELTVWTDEGAVHFPIGSRGQFEIDLPAGPWIGVVEHRGGTCRVRFEIPTVDAAFLDLGELECGEEVRL